MKPLLELESVSKQYSAQRAVDNLSILLHRGEFFSLVGPSGCGKTTTLRLIAGFETPDSGDILLDGRSIVSTKPYRRNVNTVFQSYALFPHLSVAANISFGLERRGLSKSQIRHKVAQAIELVQLSGKESRFPAQISGGERQRVALARALVLEPQVLLLDEPLSALDPNLRRQMRQELKSLQRRVDTTFLFITHDREEALSLSDRMAVMHAGKLEQIGTPNELYHRPQSRFVAEFLGSVNWMNGAGVRPEALRISTDLPAVDGRSFSGVVQSTTFLGNCLQLQTRLSNGTTCTAEIRNDDRRFVPGDAVHVWWRAEDEIQLIQNR